MVGGHVGNEKWFNPYAALDAARGLADSVLRFLLEGPGTQRVISHGDRAGLNGVVELLQSEVQALHEYFAELENLSLLDLPRDQDEFDALDTMKWKDKVREEPAMYSINRH